MVCIAEILDYFEEDGLETYTRLPYWIEDCLHSLISGNGMKTIVRLIKDMELEDCRALINAIERAYKLKIDGFDK
jgi:hypothetical protein